MYFFLGAFQKLTLLAHLFFIRHTLPPPTTTIALVYANFCLFCIPIS